MDSINGLFLTKGRMLRSSPIINKRQMITTIICNGFTQYTCNQIFRKQEEVTMVIRSRERSNAHVYSSAHPSAFGGDTGPSDNTKAKLLFFLSVYFFIFY